MLIYLSLILLVGVLLILLFVYFQQERLIFHPDLLAQDFEFVFDGDYEELFIEVSDGTRLNALHFKAPNSRGLVFYVHGNAGSLNDWSSLSALYLEHQFDFFIFDYRGFGKSAGTIFSEQQFFQDAQELYDYITPQYAGRPIVIQGFSIGTATACKLALENEVQQLVLKAPYYTLRDLVKLKQPFVPSFLLKYQFRAVNYLKQVSCPIHIFHGTIDELIPVEQGKQLAAAVPSAILTLLPNCLHNDIPLELVYQERMATLLDRAVKSVEKS